MRRLLIILLSCAAVPLAAANDQVDADGHGVSEAERARSIAAGPWQGYWRVTRDDPRITTRGGAEMLVLMVWHDEGSQDLAADWDASRAICEDPVGEPPCEWLGSSGFGAPGRIADDGSISIRFAISADADDPFTLRIPRLPAADAAVDGRFTSARGGMDWSVSIERHEP